MIACPETLILLFKKKKAFHIFQLNFDPKVFTGRNLQVTVLHNK